MGSTEAELWTLYCLQDPDHDSLLADNPDLLTICVNSLRKPDDEPYGILIVGTATCLSSSSFKCHAAEPLVCAVRGLVEQDAGEVQRVETSKDGICSTA